MYLGFVILIKNAIIYKIQNKILGVGDMINKIVEVKDGKLEGFYSNDNGTLIFKGIPFAKPPIGDLRWKAPQPVEKWEGIKKCNSYSKSAMQNPAEPFLCWTEEFIINTTLGYSEDCLYLNIWTKVENCENDKKPVIVYIHGGANVSGGTSCEIYDGENISKKDVVYVSINYRVGVFGFLAHKELSNENENKISGNYAILDQILALKWIKENISKFGGDCENVTIMGQSAGSLNVNTLIASPLAKGLFKNAVSLSFNPLILPISTLEVEEKNGTEIFKDKSIDELRKIPAEEIQKMTGHIGLFGPVVDNYVLEKDLRKSFKDGIGSDVNLIIGNVDGDVSLFTSFAYFSLLSLNFNPVMPTVELNDEVYKTSLKNIFGELYEECLELYPIETSLKESYNTLNIEGGMALINLYAKLRAETKKSDTYIFNFSRIMPGPQSEAMGAFHTADVPYWLNNFSELRKEFWLKKDFELGELMSNYLVSFAKTGNPNSYILPLWKDYENTKEKISFMSFESESVTLELEKSKNDFWLKHIENMYRQI